MTLAEFLAGKTYNPASLSSVIHGVGKGCIRPETHGEFTRRYVRYLDSHITMLSSPSYCLICLEEILNCGIGKTLLRHGGLNTKVGS